MDIQDYEIIKKLGSGVYGTVYEAIRNSDKKLIALKVIDIPDNDPKLIEETKKEIEYLKRLSKPECNPFVICYYASYHDPQRNKILIEMELIEGNTMKIYLNNLWRDKPKEMVYYYLLLIANDIAKGLKYTHDKGIIHNDIKLDNIMIDNKNVPRIIDYGLSCFSTKGFIIKQYCNSTGGTPKYIAPEILKNNERYPASDMWALGIALYIGATNGYPYNLPKPTSIKVLFNIIKTGEPNKLNTSNQQLNDLVNGLLVKNYKKRLTSDQVLAMLQNIPKPGSVQITNGSEPTRVSTDIGSFVNLKKAMSSFYLM